MRRLINPRPQEITECLTRPELQSNNLKDLVTKMRKDILFRGDIALIDYTARYDRVNIRNLVMEKDEIEAFAATVSPELKEAIQSAAKNISRFHESQRIEVKKIETAPGVVCWQEQKAIEKVGLYIPGGTAPLFSTVLMLGLPAQIAGCKEIVLCTPPNQEGKIAPAIAYAAQVAGITKIVTVGGVQAIIAMAYGTESIPSVDKIFGPGNQYVTAAKQLVGMDKCAIDMPAGPSEVMVMADKSAYPAFVAADLLSQAEHGSDSQVILVTDHEPLLDAVEEEVNKQLEALGRKALANDALTNSVMIYVDGQDKMVDIANQYAAEHLIIATENPSDIATQIRHAGSVFMGHYTPESAGDYASGTNHTLPTNGWARSYSGVNLDAFTKKITYQEISAVGLQSIGNTIEVMAAAESLDAHKNAVTVRLKQLSSNEI
ncbi:histidinol dehydrogenase [Halosquirtibacter xylanolyticus]|uniref:histidinol dehydrogenase n=1 Tax=Halosquirtibacter xylanolyticus TaxID=3374599 RepID=UPI0037487BD9|nr:histidinol dehydrogenase [Prolixibacteraceae bacterium]